MPGQPVSAEVRLHKGRPMVFINGKPNPLPAYSPTGWRRALAEKAMPRFYPHQMGAYFVCTPRVKSSEDYWANLFWRGDEISSTPFYRDAEQDFPMDEQAAWVRDGDPGAWLIVRFGLYEPKSWRDLHRDQLVVNEEGDVLEVPSLASDLAWDTVSRYIRALIEHCESRPWADRIIGYANFHRVEGEHEPLFHYWLYDHGPAMTARWRQFLAEKYKPDEGRSETDPDVALTFENAEVPRDKLRGSVQEVSSLLYWQGAKDNAPLRDYLVLTRNLYHQRFRQIFEAMRTGTDRKRLLLYDAFKQTLQGWDNRAFFDPGTSWLSAYPEQGAGSGKMGMAELMDDPGFDGLITPHDYQARGMGGVFEPEGIVDSVALRGKLFLCEMDTRTWLGGGDYGEARDEAEFAAITWRNLASALTRGYNAYWMDLCYDWFANDALHATIGRQVQVIKDSAKWPHETVPGIAMVIDDACALETNGAGNFLNEAVMWEWKMGLARCGVPFRVYLLEDLKRRDFPRHRVYYFPNLFRIDGERMELLRKKVFRDGNVVVWGPGSGISDGAAVGTHSASIPTGFEFEWWPVNYPRRTLITNFDHPITRGLRADTVIGGPLAYGPMLFPKDGTSLGLAWTKQGKNYSGLAVKQFGRGARGNPATEEGRGASKTLRPHAERGDEDALSLPKVSHLREGMARSGEAEYPPEGVKPSGGVPGVKPSGGVPGVKPSGGKTGGKAGKRGMGDYASVFTTAVPLPADLWRGIARFASAHVYCETNDVLLADSSVVALHSVQPGEKRIALPGECRVTDLITGKAIAERTREIAFRLDEPGTRVFLLSAPTGRR